MKFGIGQPVRRDEDLRLITGQGRYTDDIGLPRMTHAFVPRSPLAHARIKRIDTATARRMSGVLLVATGDDLSADGLGDVPCLVPLTSRDGNPRHDTPRSVLATEGSACRSARGIIISHRRDFDRRARRCRKDRSRL